MPSTPDEIGAHGDDDIHADTRWLPHRVAKGIFYNALIPVRQPPGISMYVVVSMGSKIRGVGRVGGELRLVTSKAKAAMKTKILEVCEQSGGWPSHVRSKLHLRTLRVRKPQMAARCQVAEHLAHEHPGMSYLSSKLPSTRAEPT